MYPDGKKKKPLLFRNLRKRYHLRLQDAQSLHDKVFLKVTKGRVYLIVFLGGFLIVLFTFFLIAYTNLRNIIPGYDSDDLAPKLYELEQRADSLELISTMQSKYIANLRSILSGEEPANEDIHVDSQEIDAYHRIDPDNIQYTRSYEDSLLRMEFEAQNDYTLLDIPISIAPSTSFLSENFKTPISGGVLTSRFSRVDRHYGIDLVGKNGAPILSTLDGTVIFSEWTAETGYVLVIQHRNELISIYKHNSSLLKKSGDYVKAGDPVAIIGNSGNLTTGTHLHFEIWYKGSPLNPEDYLIL